MYVTPSLVDVVVVVAVVCLSLCTADPWAVATRPDVNGTNQPHITRSWCATIIAYTWTDSCRDFTHSRFPTPFTLPHNHPPTYHCLGRKIAKEKKRVFRSFICFFGYFNVLPRLRTSFRHDPLMKIKSKKKKICNTASVKILCSLSDLFLVFTTDSKVHYTITSAFLQLLRIRTF